MPELWYVRRGNVVKGPFKTDVIRRVLRAGKVLESDEISRDQTTWEEVASARPRLGLALAEAAPGTDPAGEAETRDTAPGVAPAPDLSADSSPEPAPEPAPDPSPVSPSDPAPAPPLGASPEGALPGPPGPPAGEPAAATDPEAAAPAAVRRRPGSTRRAPRAPLNIASGPPRVKQVAALGSVMAIIVVAGFAFMPQPVADPADCSSAPGPSVNWSNCQLEGLEIASAELTGATLRNARLRAAQLPGVQLDGADLAFAELTGANLAYGALTSVNAVGANLREADLTYADLRGADLSHADLSGALLGGADLRGAKLDNAIWIDKRICFAGSVGGCRLPVTDPPPSRQESDG